MIFTKTDLLELEEFIEDNNSDDYDVSGHYFFNERPYLLFPSGFDESRQLFFKDDLFDCESTEEENEIKKEIHRTKEFMLEYGIKKNPFMENFEFVYRRLGSGSWSWLDGTNKDIVVFNGPVTGESISLESIYRNIENEIKNQGNGVSSIIYPRSYISLINDARDTSFKSQLSNILLKLYEGNCSLNDINPGLFEDLVAELLINTGFNIFQTPRTRDGGRDMIARKELAAGIFVEMAVEVKRKKVVDFPDVSRAIEANRNYPKLMIATSGRFSAGVIEQKKQNERILRLELLDGVGISQLVRGYIER